MVLPRFRENAGVLMVAFQGVTGGPCPLCGQAITKPETLERHYRQRHCTEARRFGVVRILKSQIPKKERPLYRARLVS
jgi:hypothetical protein